MARNPEIEPCIALFYRAEAFEATLTQLGVRWIALTALSLGDGTSRFGSALRAILGLSGTLALIRLIRRERPDLIHVHSFPGTFWIAAFKAAGLIDAPTVLTRHSLHARHGVATRMLFRWMLARYDVVTTVSGASRARLIDEFPALDIEVVHNCVADAFFAVADPDPPLDRTVFLQLGRFAPAKNHALVVDALAALTGAERAGISVWFAGAGETEASVKAQAGRLGLTANDVRFLGFVPHDELPAIMAQAHFGVFASSSEGFGIGAAECLASGRPVLALQTDVMEEVVGPGGVCVAADALASGFRTLLRSSNALRAEARRWARRYSAEYVGAAYLSLYRRALQARR